MQQCYQQALNKAVDTSPEAVVSVERAFELLLKHKKWLCDIPVVFVFDGNCEIKWSAYFVYVFSATTYYLVYELNKTLDEFDGKGEQEFFTMLSQENVSQDLVWHLRLFL